MVQVPNLIIYYTKLELLDNLVSITILAQLNKYRNQLFNQVQIGTFTHINYHTFNPFSVHFVTGFYCMSKSTAKSHGN